MKWGIAAALAATLCTPALAGRVQIVSNIPGTVFVQNGQTFITTQFAIPLGIPVAPVSFVLYQAIPGAGYVSPPLVSPSPQNPQPSPPTSDDPSKISANTSPPEASMVRRTCVACHSGEKAKAGLDLSGQLSSEVRLKAIGKVVSGEMPKGKTLTPEEVGLLIQELSSISKEK